MNTKTSLPLLGAGLVTLVLVTLGLVLLQKRKRSPVTLDKVNRVPLTLIEKEDVSHNVRRFRFSLPTPHHVLGLPVGCFLIVAAKIDGSLVIRPYTPITSDDDVGYMDLMIKVYFKDVHPKFLEGGKMTQYMNDLKIGDTIDVRGPNGKILYLGNGEYDVIKSKVLTKRVLGHKLGMIAGGSGITPMLQVIRDILKHPNDKTKISLLYCNSTEGDVLCRGELDELSKDERFSVWYTVSQPPPGEWKYSLGRITQALVSEHIPSPSPETTILLCGPDALVRITQDMLREIGHSAEQCLLF